MRTRSSGAGYGEVHTPALEYEDVLRRGDERAAGARYRTFDEQGDVLALRSDMTIPIARVVATRYADGRSAAALLLLRARLPRTAERGVGEPREFLQGGIELIGAHGAGGRGRGAGADDRGARRGRAAPPPGRAWATGRCTAGCWRRCEVPEAEHLPLLESPVAARPRRAGVRVSTGLGLGDARARAAGAGCRSCAGGRRCSSAPTGPVAEAVEGLRALHELLAERGVADRVIFDLGLVRELGYYTGAVFEVYDPAVGFALGGGGRYDDLLGRFGRSLPACGVALDVQRVHMAQAAEEALA